ncbi:MAG TPA: protein-disulfide reductase DsbD domain-containing protein [Edaphocola sp.]|nr:protein-disulfide reductase DsbD domain-containing protein [Edaphocola sp.]
MNRILCFFVLLGLLPFYSHAQNVNDIVKWHYSAEKTGNNTFEVSLKATIKQGWHIYTGKPGGDGSQIPTEVNFLKSPAVKINGPAVPVGKITSETIDAVGTIHYYRNTVTYKQKVTAGKNTVLKGYISFQTCNEQMCLPPADDSFSIDLKGISVTDGAAGQQQESGNISDSQQNAAIINTGNRDSGSVTADTIITKDTNISAANSGTSSNDGNSISLWAIFLTGLGAGFLAFVTPCIYAMLPITVSFFTKRSKDKATGLKNATIYSASIIGIFLIVGILISVLFSETTMYSISTSAAFNLFVFAVFAIFGISLLGAFEITLPSSWSSKLDTKANTSNFWGIFFMALVLVIVSFSCTSAFISFLIVQIVQAHNRLGGMIGFLGFGTAIALPFALFAFFPGMLNNIAKSGGWLNSVKVVMGFIELAMAMKFLSNVDLQYHWHLLDYNVYLSIWIILFGLLGLYLLGKIKFSHDDDLPKNMFGQPYLSVTRFFLAVATFAFTVYMIPGMFGAPLIGIGGWLPEKNTLNANFYDKLDEIKSMGLSSGSTTLSPLEQKYAPKKYTDFLTSEIPGVMTYYDFEEALAASKALHKPVLLDFTGHSCVNCRKMEAAVLKQPEIMQRLKNDFILASLFCDERGELAPEDQYKTKDGQLVKTIGAKNIDIESNKYGEVGQPIYIFVDSDGNVLKKAGGYVPDVPRFVSIMDQVKKQFDGRAK